jgi:hypothetical protein
VDEVQETDSSSSPGPPIEPPAAPQDEPFHFTAASPSSATQKVLAVHDTEASGPLNTDEKAPHPKE